MEMPKLEGRVRLFNDVSGRPTKLLAFADLVIGDSFVIKNIRVLLRQEPGEEPFVVYPAEKGKNASEERWYDVAHPITAEARSAASVLVLERYRQACEGAQALARR
jgi:stage V sporulation protein G